MPRNGLKAVEAPNELYDSLSQDGQDTWDAIGAFGYVPEKGIGGLWFARRPGDEAKDAIGPSESISVLLSMMKETVPAVVEDAVIVDLDDLPPSERLPGMEEPAIDELDRQADKCIVAKEQKEKAAAAKKDEEDLMRQIMRTHGRKRYTRSGFSLVIEDSEKLVIKKAEQPKRKEVAKAA